jgi:hypothetical protein
MEKETSRDEGAQEKGERKLGCPKGGGGLDSGPTRRVAWKSKGGRRSGFSLFRGNHPDLAEILCQRRLIARVSILTGYFL